MSELVWRRSEAGTTSAWSVFSLTDPAESISGSALSHTPSLHHTDPLWGTRGLHTREGTTFSSNKSITNYTSKMQ